MGWWSMPLGRLCRSAPALAAGLALAACSTAHMDTRPTQAAEDAYTALYPYYAEICAVSELKKKPAFGTEISSGIGGHAVLYLNGVCRDAGEHYPVIRLCDALTPAAERGVGLSVNAHYRNANWVATPGRDFFFHGTLRPGERLTRAAYRQTLARAQALGIYDGVQFHGEVFDAMPEGMSRRDFKYDVSAATDYAIGFGRDRYCARVPLDRERMARVVDFANRLNAVYRDGRKAFQWDVLRNNCSHVNHNALAAAGIWSPWETERSILIAAFDFPVPKNEFVNLMRRTNDLPIDDIDALYEEEAARRTLLGGGVLPTAPGALAEAEPAVQENDVYDTDLSLIFYDYPIFGSYERHFRKIFSEPRYLDLVANLRHFDGLYRKIERRREPLDAFLARHDAASPAERDALARFHEAYYREVARERAAVEAGLALLRGAAGRAMDRLKALAAAEGCFRSGAAAIMGQNSGDEVCWRGVE